MTEHGAGRRVGCLLARLCGAAVVKGVCVIKHEYLTTASPGMYAAQTTPHHGIQCSLHKNCALTE